MCGVLVITTTPVYSVFHVPGPGAATEWIETHHGVDDDGHGGDATDADHSRRGSATVHLDHLEPRPSTAASVLADGTPLELGSSQGTDRISEADKKAVEERRRKINELDDAMAAGLLTEQEYQVRAGAREGEGGREKWEGKRRSVTRIDLVPNRDAGCI